MIPCGRCGFEPPDDRAQFCSRCGSKIIAPDHNARTDRAPDSHYVIGGRTGPARPKTLVSLLASLLGLRHWLAEASDPRNSPILGAPVSENAKRVYIYLAGIVYAFGSSHSRLDTIAK